MSSVYLKPQGSPDWTDTEAEVETLQPNQRLVIIGAHSEVGARMSAGLGTKWLARIGHPSDPDVFNGVVRTWIPQGDRLRLVVQAAATIQDLG